MKALGLSAWSLTIFLVIIAVATITFAATGRYARKETVTGHLVPIEGSFSLAARIAGTVAGLTVQEGQRVQRGQKLASISIDPILADGGNLSEKLRASHRNEETAASDSAAAKADELAKQIDELKTRGLGLAADIVRLGKTREILKRRAKLQGATLSAHQDLAARGMVSASAIRQQQDTALAIEQQLTQVEREIELQHSQHAQIGPQVARLQAASSNAAAMAQVTSAQLAERQLNDDARYSQTIVSPIEGLVAALPYRPGNHVSAGQTIVVIVPVASINETGHFEVELWAPSRAVGFLRPGMPVRLMFDSFPYQTFGVGRGVVKRVSMAPVPSSEVQGAGETKEKLYHIAVTLLKPGIRIDGKEAKLVPGMRVTADLLMEEQSFLGLVFGPLRAASQRKVRWE